MSEPKEETYQDDLRYERAVFPEKFTDLRDNRFIACLERLTLAVQGIDISLEKLAESKNKFDPLTDSPEG